MFKPIVNFFRNAVRKLEGKTPKAQQQKIPAAKHGALLPGFRMRKLPKLWRPMRSSPPLHQQPEYMEWCRRRVFRWFKHHDPRFEEIPGSIREKMNLMVRVSGREEVYALIQEAVRFGSVRTRR